MARRLACTLLIPASLVLVGCFGPDPIDANAYTCGEFKKSLDTKGDDTAGQYIRLLNDRAKTGGRRADQERLMAYSIYVACRGKKAAFTPDDAAIANARKIKAGKRVVPADVAEAERKAAEKKAAEAEKPEE